MQNEKPSATSTMVALGSFCVVQEMRKSDVDQRIEYFLSEILRRSPEPFAFAAALSRSRLVRKFLETLINFAIPGMFTHYMARKLFIEKKVRESMEDGAEQLVVIGGGLDTLAMRISQDYPQSTVIEIDHPATQKLKLHCINELGIDRKRLETIPVDLNLQKISDILSHTNHLTSKKTICLIEGVLMYFHESEVKKILDDLKASLHSSSILILTFMEKGEDGRTFFTGSKKGLVNLWLRRHREPFIWGLPQSEASHFFKSCGWLVSAQSSWEELSRLVSSAQPFFKPPAKSEHIFVLNQIV